jgi:hypothetical protein
MSDKHFCDSGRRWPKKVRQGIVRQYRSRGSLHPWCMRFARRQRRCNSVAVVLHPEETSK